MAFPLLCILALLGPLAALFLPASLVLGALWLVTFLLLVRATPTPIALCVLALQSLYVLALPPETLLFHQAIWTLIALNAMGLGLSGRALDELTWSIGVTAFGIPLALGWVLLLPPSDTSAWLGGLVSVLTLMTLPWMWRTLPDTNPLRAPLFLFPAIGAFVSTLLLGPATLGLFALALAPGLRAPFLTTTLATAAALLTGGLMGWLLFAPIPVAPLTLVAPYPYFLGLIALFALAAWRTTYHSRWTRVSLQSLLLALGMGMLTQTLIGPGLLLAGAMMGVLLSLDTGRPLLLGADKRLAAQLNRYRYTPTPAASSHNTVEAPGFTQSPDNQNKPTADTDTASDAIPTPSARAKTPDVPHRLRVPTTSPSVARPDPVLHRPPMTPTLTPLSAQDPAAPVPAPVLSPSPFSSYIPKQEPPLRRKDS